MEDLMRRVGGSVPGDARGGGQLTPRLRAAMASVLSRRTGHARFRRGPVVVPPAEHLQQTPDGAAAKMDAAFSASASSSHPSTTLVSFTVTAGGEGSVSGGYRGLFQSASDRARSENDDGAGGKPRGGRCHCSKKRKPRVVKVIRVPAISSRNADIPPDDYSWRKYGQKPIKGSPYPRGYYKCSTVRGCPARKHVERDPGEPAMLIVTYEGDHRHDTRPAPDQGIERHAGVDADRH